MSLKVCSRVSETPYSSESALPKVKTTGFLGRTSQCKKMQEITILRVVNEVLGFLKGLDPHFTQMSWIEEGSEPIAVFTYGLEGVITPTTDKVIQKAGDRWLSEIAGSLTEEIKEKKHSEKQYRTVQTYNPGNKILQFQYHRELVDDDEPTSYSVKSDTPYKVYCTGFGGALIAESLKQSNSNFSTLHLEVFTRQQWCDFASKIKASPVNKEVKAAVHRADIMTKRFENDLDGKKEAIEMLPDDKRKGIESKEGVEFIDNLHDVVMAAFQSNESFFYYRRLLTSLEAKPNESELIYAAAMRATLKWTEEYSLKGCSSFKTWTPKKIRKLEKGFNL